jgi:hypothetical protein
MDKDVFAEIGFGRAKAGLSELMTEVVHGHHLRLVRRHHGKEAMLLVAPNDLDDLLDLARYRFDPQVTIDKDEVTVALRDLGVLGFGDSAAEAMEDLVEELRAYATRFFERWSFYRETDRRKHAPWLLRFALTPSDRQLELLYEDSRLQTEESSQASVAATR